MNVVVTGASGLLSDALVRALRGDGHDVVRLIRRAPRGRDERRWDPGRGYVDPDALAHADAVVNLAGVGVGDKRWSPHYRDLLLRSRVESTATLARAIAARPGSRPMLLSMSGVNYYGDTREDAVDESAPRGDGFLASLCEQWEAATGPAVDAGARVVTMRTGVVLTPEGGALARILPVFRWGIGGRLGSGRQWMSWIALPDYVAAVRFLLVRADIGGAVNLTAPEPVRNIDYTKALARAVHRPAWTFVPPFALRAVLGGFADEGVLISLRVLPARLEAAGFGFGYEDVDAALQALLG